MLSEILRAFFWSKLCYKFHMKQQDILHYRINNQLLGKHTITAPEQVVEHLLCIQWQDLKQAKRAIASRLWRWISLSDIEKAFNEWKIVRTRTQRWTIHVVCTKDVSWMVKLCASKTLKSFERRKEQLGVDHHQYTDALTHLEEYLATWPKSRKDISSHLSTLWITIQSGIVYNILCFAGSSWMIVQWPIIDGEHTFALTKEWCKDAVILDEQEALKECAYRYFMSHWPATIEDFMWWSGLNKTQIKKGIELCWEKLQKHIVDGKEYRWPIITNGAEGRVWLSYADSLLDSSTTSTLCSDSAQVDSTKAHLLAGFDEFLLWYKDRTATLHLDHHTKVDAARNWVFKPTIMIDGETVWIWSVKSTKKKHIITVKAFDVIEKKHHQIIDDAVKEYLQFTNSQLEHEIEYI